MNNENSTYTIKDVLKIEVAPALGCTEPAAVALCTAAAASLLKQKTLESIELWLSSNIYKNAFAVVIPGTEAAVGIELTAALGYICGDPKRRLEVLEPVDRDETKLAMDLVSRGQVKINLLREKSGIYIRVRLRSGGEEAEAVIEDTHDNLTALRRNGEAVDRHPLLSHINASQSTVHELEEFLKHQPLVGLLALVENMDTDDFDFVRRGVKYNLDLADHGLAFGSGLGVDKTLERLAREGLVKRDMMLAARILTSSACDARMSGVKLPAMSSAGSGNHGLTAILPIWAVKDYVDGVAESDVLRAVALSHVITAYIKAHTGRLSAVCGCSVAAGAGATAGVTYLLGGNVYHIASAIKNLIVDLAGVICDGAKASCSFKLATAAGTAVQSALFALHGISVAASDGIIGLTPEQTMQNMGQISTEGMIETDRTILRILMDKRFSQ